MLLRQIALLSKSDKVALPELTRVSAALQLVSAEPRQLGPSRISINRSKGLSCCSAKLPSYRKATRSPFPNLPASAPRSSSSVLNRANSARLESLLTDRKDSHAAPPNCPLIEKRQGRPSRTYPRQRRAPARQC